MKRVHVRNGLKQRLNEIVGTDTGADDSNNIPVLTPWSVQAAMIADMKRIVSGVVGDSSCGRPMRGLWLTISQTQVSVSAGYGFTRNGDVIRVETSFTFGAQTGYVYLRHFMSEVNGDDFDDGKKSDFIGRAGSENIVYDDYAASKHEQISINGNFYAILRISPSQIEPDDAEFNDLVYVGRIISAYPFSVSNSIERGLGPSPDSKTYFGDTEISGDLLVNGETTLNGAANISGTATFNGFIKAGARTGFSGAFNVGGTTYTVINGLIVI